MTKSCHFAHQGTEQTLPDADGSVKFAAPAQIEGETTAKASILLFSGIQGLHPPVSFFSKP
ncbi:hypothetical protein CKO51_02085 [Rhodopirellula sp. SM50]|nr:hypothetical protein CKO51_02085 [Rhodopirellula sp. SM50]